jgi:hypothetical protein
MTINVVTTKNIFFLRKGRMWDFVHEVFTLNEKLPWLTQDSKPDPLAQKSDVQTCTVHPTINVLKVFYFFEKKSKSMLSSMEAKSTINVVNIFNFLRKLKNHCHHHCGQNQ